MEKHDTGSRDVSRVTWDGLEGWIREKVQELLQNILEEEVTELLGRARSKRRGLVDGSAGYRNGHGKERHLTLQSGTVAVRRPRVRGLEEGFTSRILPVLPAGPGRCLR